MTHDIADHGPAAEVEPRSLPARRPAELTTFVASLVAVAAAAGLNLSTEVVIAAFGVLGLAPAVVSWYVDLYKDAFRGRID